MMANSILDKLELAKKRMAAAAAKLASAVNSIDDDTDDNKRSSDANAATLAGISAYIKGTGTLDGGALVRTTDIATVWPATGQPVEGLVPGAELVRSIREELNSIISALSMLDGNPDGPTTADKLAEIVAWANAHADDFNILELATSSSNGLMSYLHVQQINQAITDIAGLIDDLANTDSLVADHTTEIDTLTTGLAAAVDVGTANSTGLTTALNAIASLVEVVGSDLSVPASTDLDLETLPCVNRKFDLTTLNNPIGSVSPPSPTTGKSMVIIVAGALDVTCTSLVTGLQKATVFKETALRDNTTFELTSRTRTVDVHYRYFSRYSDADAWEFSAWDDPDILGNLVLDLPALTGLTPSELSTKITTSITSNTVVTIEAVTQAELDANPTANTDGNIYLVIE